MKTLTLDDRLYSELEDYSEASGRSISELASEAIEAWLADTILSESELKEIEAAELDYLKHGGVEAGEFFRSVREEWLQERPRGADVAHPSYHRTRRRSFST